MKTLLAVAVAALSLSATAAKAQFVSPPRADCIVNVGWDTLNMRTVPNGVIVGILASGTRVGAYDFAGNWAFVQNWSVDTNMSGWVFLPYLVCRPL